MLHPAASARRTSPSDEAVLQSAVLALDHAISLGMIRGGAGPRDAQRLREVSPKLRGELPSLVRDYSVRDAKSRDPVSQ